MTDDFSFRSVYADSSADPLDDPKVETIVELLRRIWVSHRSSVALGVSVSDCV